MPDVPYHIQFVFIGTFSFIWYNGLIKHLINPLPDSQTLNPEQLEDLNVSKLKKTLTLILERKLEKRYLFKYYFLNGV